MLTAVRSFAHRVAERLPQSRRVRGTLVAAAALTVIAAMSVGPVARGRATAAAARRGFVLHANGVSLGWFAVTLRDVEIFPEGLEHIRVTAPEVRVEVDGFARLRAVELHTGEAVADGTLDSLESELRAWRTRHPSLTESNSPKSRAVTVRGYGLSLHWHDGEGGQIDVTGVSFSRDGTNVELSLEHANARAKSAIIELEVATVVFGGATIKKAHATSAAVVWAPRHEPTPSSAGAAGSASTPVPNVASAKPAAFTATDGAEEPLVTLPNPHALRARAGMLAELLASHLDEDGTVNIDGLSFAYERAPGDRLSLGPGPWSLTRQAHAIIDVEYTTSSTMAAAAGARGTPLSVHAHLAPSASSTDMRVSLAGGPIAIGYLGAKEGAAGVVDVDRATLTGRGDIVLSPEGDAITFDVDLGVRGFGIQQPRIAFEAVRGLDLGVSARGVLADDHGTRTLRLDDGEAIFGAFHLRGHGTLATTTEQTTSTVAFEIPTASCQSLLDSIPAALVPTVQGAKMKGTFGGRGRLAFESNKLDELALNYDIDDECKMTMVPEVLAKERFGKPFLHKVYLPDGTTTDEETGPTSAAWTDLDAISPYMQVAVTTTEDGAFFHHTGFNHAAIKNSLIANLKARRFVRGASTISMQLAKNLFLSREKTLSRKLEELILTDYLEQNFTKNELMELYLNVIEFGPDVYGVRHAADYYFGRRPEELSLSESLFLATLLPRPLGAQKMYEKGEAPEGVMKTLHTLMQVAFKNGKLSQPELNQGLSERVVFHKPDEAAPPKRPPVTGTRLMGEDQDWKPLD